MPRPKPPSDQGRRCHDPQQPAPAGGAGEGLSAPALMPIYEVGDPLSADEQAILRSFASLVHELAPDIPEAEVQPDRTLWEIGYDSLGLVALRMGVRRLFGPEAQPLYWLRLHSEVPRIGCFIRFLAANGVGGSTGTG